MYNISAVLYGIEDLRIEETPTPDPGRGEVAVSVQVVGVCGSDTHYYTHGAVGRFVVETPLVLGHEAAGVISAVGEGVDNVSPGDRVAIEPGVACGKCRYCRQGHYNLCPFMAFMATPPHNGALTKTLVTKSQNVYVLPDEMTFEEGALLEPLSVGIWANQKAGTSLGDHVLISGAGPVGLLAAEVARALGASSIDLVDINETRLSVAAAHGFGVRNVARDPFDKKGDGSYDLLIECSGAPGALDLGLWQVHAGGRAVMVGIPGSASVTLSLPALHDREMSVSTIFRYANTWPTAIELVQSGRVHISDLITHRFPLSEAAKALIVARTDESVVKAAVLPQV
jgi:L-iditol 2-dehydrogenase